MAVRGREGRRSSARAQNSALDRALFRSGLGVMLRMIGQQFRSAPSGPSGSGSGSGGKAVSALDRADATIATTCETGAQTFLLLLACNGMLARHCWRCHQAAYSLATSQRLFAYSCNLRCKSRVLAPVASQVDLSTCSTKDDNEAQSYPGRLLESDDEVAYVDREPARLRYHESLRPPYLTPSHHPAPRPHRGPCCCVVVCAVCCVMGALCSVLCGVWRVACGVCDVLVPCVCARTCLCFFWPTEQAPSF